MIDEKIENQVKKIINKVNNLLCLEVGNNSLISALQIKEIWAKQSKGREAIIIVAEKIIGEWAKQEKLKSIDIYCLSLDLLGEFFKGIITAKMQEDKNDSTTGK